MRTLETPSPLSDRLSNAAAYKPGMTQLAPATPSTISEEIRQLAVEALKATNGRAHHGIEDDIARENAELVALGYDRQELRRASGTGKISLDLKMALERRPDDPLVLAKQQIVFKLLDPSLDLALQAARRRAGVSPYIQDRIAMRLAEILEQKVLQDPPTGLDLRMLVGETPMPWSAHGEPEWLDDEKTVPAQWRKQVDGVGWARMLVLGSVGATLKRVLQNEGGHILDPFNTEIDPDETKFRGNIYSAIIDVSRGRSAEEMAMDRTDDEIDRMLEMAENLEGEPHIARGTAKSVLEAARLRDAFDIPELLVPTSNAEKRAIANAIDADPTVARRSLTMAADGDFDYPTQVLRDMAPLWDDFSAEVAERVLSLEGVLHTKTAEISPAATLVRAAVALPARPSRETLRAARTAVRDLASVESGWPTLAGQLFDSFVADHYARFSDYDNRHNSRTDKTAEADALAARFPELAGQALTWPGRPLGRRVKTEAELAAWLVKVIA